MKIHVTEEQREINHSLYISELQMKHTNI